MRCCDTPCFLVLATYTRTCVGHVFASAAAERIKRLFIEPSNAFDIPAPKQHSYNYTSKRKLLQPKQCTLKHWCMIGAGTHEAFLAGAVSGLFFQLHFFGTVQSVHSDDPANCMTAG